MDDDDTRRYSADAIKSRIGKSTTQANAPHYAIDPEFWQTARVVMPEPGKAPVNLRVDRDVLAWFRAQGKGHLTRMNAVLRSYMDAHRS